jgi:hypothetical protein
MVKIRYNEYKEGVNRKEIEWELVKVWKDLGLTNTSPPLSTNNPFKFFHFPPFHSILTHFVRNSFYFSIIFFNNRSLTLVFGVDSAY